MIPKQPLQATTESEEKQYEVIVKVRTEIPRQPFLSSQLALGMLGVSPLDSLASSRKIASITPLFDDRGDSNDGPLRNAFSESRKGLSFEDKEEPSLAGLNVIRFYSEQDAAAAVLALSSDPAFEYAHIPAPRYFAATDPEQNRQWGLRAIDYFNAINTLGFNNARHIKIAILDSGIDPGHTDLKGIFSTSVNFSTMGANDDSGHGTHVAGIIAALTNNGIGITGACESKQLMILRGLTDPYSSTAYYQALRHAVSNNAQVLNCSLGGPHDPTEALIISTGIAKGMIVVAAMGNDFQRGNPTSYPAALPDVIAVGATDEVDRRAAFSQTGAHLWICAPGTNILSTVPTYKVPLTTQLSYDAWDGTSMATPFVTAAVALLLAKRPSATLSDIKQALATSAHKPAGGGFTKDMGHGRLNLEAALKAI